MSADIERNLGEQPIARIMAEHALSAKHLVAASTEQITHKMVARACKGRWLTPHVKAKIRNALNRAVGANYAVDDLFSYPDKDLDFSEPFPERQHGRIP